jgi:hypothetical protein
VTDKPTRRVLYSKEGDDSIYTMMTDSIIETPCKNVFACYTNMKILDDIYPTFENVHTVKEVNETMGLAYAR